MGNRNPKRHQAVSLKQNIVDLLNEKQKSQRDLFYDNTIVTVYINESGSLKPTFQPQSSL
jgi:hypothetical protein